MSFAALAAPAAAQLPGGGGKECIGDTEAAAVPQVPGPLVRYGAVPGVEAGQSGAAPAEAVPEDPAQTHSALELLRPRTGVMFVRLNRLFWSEGEEGIRRFETLVDRYASRGYLIEIQLRYHPSEQQEGDIPVWTEYVREVVRRLGSHPAVRHLQVTNEVTITFSADSSDGAFEGARDALIEGVVAAQDEKGKIGATHLEIGFNWFYRLDTATENSFWGYLRNRGGPRFVEAVDWIGLDAYPGTFFPPVEQPGEERDGMVNAFSQLRCWAEIPGIPPSVPIHVTENGWPTSPVRTEQRQAVAAGAMLSAVHDFRGTYNITDYRWHNLRDGDSSDPRQEQRYGLMHDDYTPKPAFDVVCRFFSQHSTPDGQAECDSAGPRLRLKLAYRRGRTPAGGACARGPVRASIVGSDRGSVAAADFTAGRRSVARDRTAPFAARVGRRLLRRGSATRIGATTALASGREVSLSARVRACRAGADSPGRRGNAPRFTG